MANPHAGLDELAAQRRLSSIHPTTVEKEERLVKSIFSQSSVNDNIFSGLDKVLEDGVRNHRKSSATGTGTARQVKETLAASEAIVRDRSSDNLSASESSQYETDLGALYSRMDNVMDELEDFVSVDNSSIGENTLAQELEKLEEEEQHWIQLEQQAAKAKKEIAARKQAIAEAQRVAILAKKLGEYEREQKRLTNQQNPPSGAQSVVLHAKDASLEIDADLHLSSDELEWLLQRRQKKKEKRLDKHQGGGSGHDRGPVTANNTPPGKVTNRSSPRAMVSPPGSHGTLRHGNPAADRSVGSVTLPGPYSDYRHLHHSPAGLNWEASLRPSLHSPVKSTTPRRHFDRP